MDLIDLFNRNSERENTLKSLSVFESEYKVKVPPLLTLFYTLYNNNFYDTSPLKYFNIKLGRVKQFYSFECILNQEYEIVEFFPIDQIFPNINRIYNVDHQVMKNKYIPIGECLDQGYLLVGTEPENIDQIFIEYGHKNQIEFVCDNIFVYVMSHIVSLRERDLPDNYGLINLYRNWNEDFWRIRGEEENS